MITAMLCMAHFAAAQNSIDNMVEKFSSVGKSKLTCVVERHPSTRKIKKVVRVIDLYAVDVQPFIDAFKREASTGTFKEKRGDGYLSMVLAVAKKRQNRVYMLTADGFFAKRKRRKTYANATVTVIVKYE